MLLIHTSDWHIGHTFYRFDREDEHTHVFRQLARIMEDVRPDALVVSGDIFHNAAPSVTAQQLFVDTILQLHSASPDTVIVISAGNHDSGSRLGAHSRLWRQIGIHVVGTAVRDERGYADPAQFIVDVADKGRIVVVPFFHPSNYPLMNENPDRSRRGQEFFAGLMDTAADTDMPLVLMAHVAVQGCDTKGHEDATVGGMAKDPLSDLSDGYDYLALGHIHCPQKISERAYYCGSPLPVSFAEDYQHFVNLVNISHRGAMPEVIRLPLAPLRNVVTIECDSFDDALGRLLSVPDNEGDYYRLLIDSSEPIPTDADDCAIEAVKGKQCRYCETRKVLRSVPSGNNGRIQVEDIQDMEAYAPLDIARQSWNRLHGEEMNDELAQMLSEAIKLAET